MLGCRLAALSSRNAMMACQQDVLAVSQSLCLLQALFDGLFYLQYSVDYLLQSKPILDALYGHCDGRNVWRTRLMGLYFPSSSHFAGSVTTPHALN